MLGLIIWAILILFIVICICPDFFLMMAVATVVYIIVYALVSWAKSKLK